MRVKRVPVAGGDAIWLIRARDRSWTTRVRIAADHESRRRGMRAGTAGVGLLLRARSVHGFGMQGPLAVVALDRHGVVIARDVLRPHRIVTRLRARFMVEVGPDTELPPPGTALVAERRRLGS